MAEALIPAEEPGGMTWDEVKGFLDHIRTTCMDERQALKLEVRRLKARVEKLETAIAKVLADEESGEGGWGPDVTMVAVLKEALDG